MKVAQPTSFANARHPEQRLGPVTALYVWQYPLRFFHWALVISIGVLSLTGYYIHNPFIVGQVNHPFLMAWFRFVHEAFGMFFIALFLLRIYLFFGGNRWVGLRQYVPLRREQFKEMWEVMKFYGFIRQGQSRRSATTPSRPSLTWAFIRWCLWRSSRDWSCSIGCDIAQS